MRQQLLYCKGAACGLSPWFLAHSNLFQDNLNVRSYWYNVINSDNIEEYWSYRTYEYYNDLSKRVVFAKKSKILGDGYVFLGIYQPEKPTRSEKEKLFNGKIYYRKFYKLVGNIYP